MEGQSDDLSKVMQAERERVEKLLAEIWYDKDRFDAIVKFAVDQVERGRALLPEVDGDAEEAERIAYEVQYALPRDFVLAGIRRGRELERGA